jgi:hypothetical protein
MCTFTGILRLVNHGSSNSIFLIANFGVLFQKYSCEENYFSRFHVPWYLPPNWYKERSINENPRSILLFALSEYFAKGKYFSRFHRPCCPPPPPHTHTPTYTKNDRIMKAQEVLRKACPRLTQTKQYIDRDLSISQHAQWRTMKTFQCVPINDTNHPARHYFI